MSQKAVRAALEARLAAWAAARVPALPIAWENTAAPSAMPYLRVNLLPASTRSDTLDGAHRAFSGVLQAMAVVSPGQGPAVAETIAAELDALFPAALVLTGPPAIQITEPASTAPALQDDESYRVPVSIRYRADT